MLAATTAEPEQAWMQAADAGDVAALQSLLAAHPHLLNARVHHQTFKQSTALHLAAWRDHSHAVEFLVDQGADIELQDQTGMTALQIDVMRVCLQKMRPTVLRRSRCLDSQSPVALALAKRMQVRDRSSYRDIDTSVLDLLLDHDACVDKANEVGDTALLNAVEYGLIKHVEKLLAHGANVHAQDQSGRSAMDIAGEHGFVDIVNVLAESCPELLHSVGEKTLVMAVRHEFSGVLESLYDRVQRTLGREDAVELGGRLLHIAAEYDAQSCALFLLSRGASSEWRDKKGHSTVQMACTRGRPEILELLLQSDTRTEGENVEIGRVTPDGAVLLHRFIKMDVLGNCETSVSFLRGASPFLFPAFVTVKMPVHMEIMEVLIRDSAKFDFPTKQSRDAIAPLLASWLLRVSPNDVKKLLVDIANSGCIRHKELSHVVLALAWQDHTHEALMLTLMLLFSPYASDTEQALGVFRPWMLRFEANLVTRKLLVDALHF